MNKLSSQYVLDIIRSEMALSEEQTILRDQNFNYPGDRRLYVVAGIVRGIPMAAGNYTTDSDNPSVQSSTTKVQMREFVQVDIASRDNSAVLRNWELIAALNSLRSQQVQEKNQFKIFRLPDQLINTSSAEGTAQLNRYTLTFTCFSWYMKSKLLAPGDYYDDFTTRLDDSDTIGTDTPLAEFEINQGGIVP